MALPRGRDQRDASYAFGFASASIFGANPFERRCHFPLAGKRNALALAVLGATATAGDAVEGPGHEGFARGRVPIENIRRAEVEALQVAKTPSTLDGRKPGQSLSWSARLRHRVFSWPDLVR